MYADRCLVTSVLAISVPTGFCRKVHSSFERSAGLVIPLGSLGALFLGLLFFCDSFSSFLASFSRLLTLVVRSDDCCLCTASDS